MKRIYSIILLLSFMTGALQPVMPMVEYQLYEGSLVEFFGSGREHSDKPCDVSSQLMKDDCKNKREDAQQNLLDDDYYPLAIQITAPPRPIAVPNKKKLEIFLPPNINDPLYFPNPPPPRLS